MNKQVNKQKNDEMELIQPIGLRALYKIDTPSDPYYLSQTDVSSIDIRLDTSVLATTNMNRRE